jgi:hypothetical protein
MTEKVLGKHLMMAESMIATDHHAIIALRRKKSNILKFLL